MVLLLLLDYKMRVEIYFHIQLLHASMGNPDIPVLACLLKWHTFILKNAPCLCVSFQHTLVCVSNFSTITSIYTYIDQKYKKYRGVYPLPNKSLELVIDLQLAAGQQLEKFQTR